MVKFTITTYFALIFVTSVFGGEDRDRDEWYKLKRKYDDLPRIFDIDEDCPAKVFYLDCNICNCEDGKYADCTRLACAPVPQIVNWENGKACPAGKPFYWKCNDCRCADNGREASCTRKNCPDFSKEE